MQSEEQNSIQSYIDALRLSREIDEKSPCSNQVMLFSGYFVRRFFGEELSVILQRANEALYDSKQKGRNRFSKK